MATSGLPCRPSRAFLKVFRRLINGWRAPEQIYLVHDASHVLTGTTFTHDEPPLVLLAGEAVEQGFYFARGAPELVGWFLFYGGAFVECARRSPRSGRCSGASGWGCSTGRTIMPPARA